MLKRILFLLLILYTVLLGATFNGFLQPNLRLIDAALVGVVLVAWLVSRRHWRWHRTALDGVMLVWAAAFALSLAANSDDWRKIGLGLWFVGLYVGVWFLLQDAFANRALRREWLVDGLLIAGAVTTLVSYTQVENALVHHVAIPRPVGTFGNPNFLAALLVMLLPLIAGRLRTARSSLARVLLGVDGVATLGMIALSFSRGGWIAAGVALAVWAVLSLPLLRWWKAMPLAIRALVIIVIVGGVAVVARVIIQSLGVGGRGLEFRSWIYETGLKLFTEHPLTGTGLFTVGQGLAQFNAMPLYEPHSHLHNILLNVAAELGLVGLLALALTAWVTLRGAIRVKDPLAIMGLSAFAGAVVHQLFDMPVMMPAIALVAVAVLVLALPATVADARRRWQPTLIAAGSAMVVITGLWSALTYNAYFNALSAGLGSGDYLAAAAHLQAVEAADPMMPIYPEERGTLLGLAASSGSLDSAKEGVTSFARAVALAPEYTANWANLAALQEQTGDLQAASESMARAAQLAPISWSIVYRAGDYAEAAGKADAAQTLYAQSISLEPDMVLLPDWKATPLRSAIPVEIGKLSAIGQTIVLLERGQVQDAQTFWDAYPGRSSDSTSDHVTAAIIALTKGDRQTATAELDAASRAIIELNGPNDRAWIHLGMALLNPQAFDTEITAAHQELYVAPAGSDWPLGINIAYLQYLHLAIPRLFLPQVSYTESNPLLIHLLAQDDSLAELRAVTASG